MIKYINWFPPEIALAKIIGAISGLPYGPYTVKNLKPVQEFDTNESNYEP